jgi:hypothetical protein
MRGPKYSTTKTVLQAIWYPVTWISEYSIVVAQVWFQHTHILDENLASCNYSWLIDKASLAVLKSLLGGGIIDTNTVVVPEPGLFCDLDLEVLDGGVGINLNRLWEVLDGLPRSYRVLIKVER